MPAAVSTFLCAAMLAASLPLTADGQAQLLPFGQFTARDGRPGPGKAYQVSNAQGAMLAAEMNAIAARTPIVIDYDHQTIHGVANGQPAPAAGWIKSVSWRDGAGLFAVVDWTPRAKTYIDGREYRFISPVLTHDAEGRVTGVLLAALVNYPALTGMEPVIAALSTFFPQGHQPQPSSMTTLATTIREMQHQLVVLSAQINGVTYGTSPSAACAEPVTALSAEVAGKLGVDLKSYANFLKKAVEPSGEAITALSAEVARNLGIDIREYAKFVSARGA